MKKYFILVIHKLNIHNKHRELRKKHEDWKSVRWQKINVKSLNEQIESQLNMLNNLTRESQSWDISIGMRQDILDIKVNIIFYLDFRRGIGFLCVLFDNVMESKGKSQVLKMKNRKVKVRVRF